MRGTGRQVSSVWALLRFIPAHAGNRSRGAGRDGRGAVHPRACGEQMSCAASFSKKFGSSPRMRGTVENVAGHVSLGRFIPAHAGNRKRLNGSSKSMAVHPRACGEQAEALPRGPCHAGSSPRMRGTVVAPLALHAVLRFIPAHAGNSAPCAVARTDGAVHPRACGEQRAQFEQEYLCSGSSPRMRGTAQETGRKWPLLRFIPAHAGNRASSASRTTCRAVHPRACGEQAR